MKKVIFLSHRTAKPSDEIGVPVGWLRRPMGTMQKLSKNLLLLLVTASLLITNCKNEHAVPQEKEALKWEYPDSLDAVKAAPTSHEILLENEEVRVILVKIKPGEKEPMHTHQWKSIMIVDHPARIKYYDEKDKLLMTSPKENFSYEKRKPQWMEAEDLHAVENIDTIEYSAIRIELKR